MLEAGSTGLAEREFKSSPDLGAKGRVLTNRFGRRPLAMSAIPRFADSARTSPEAEKGHNRTHALHNQRVVETFAFH
jgi:hypothetical protein